MANFLHIGATVLCPHGGQAKSNTMNLRVKIGGQPIITQNSIYNIAACPNTPGPCTMVQWLRGSLRIIANGIPVLLSDSNSICLPTGGALNIVQTQTRVKGL